MSVRCRCYQDFPPQNFRKIRDADEFCTRMRFSTVFMPLDNDGTRFGCRRCGQVWGFHLPSEPPYSWRPENAPPEAPAPVVWKGRSR